MYPHFRSWRRTGQGGKETRPEQRFGEDLLAKTRVNRVSRGKRSMKPNVLVMSSRATGPSYQGYWYASVKKFQWYAEETVGAHGDPGITAA